jgi:hypothetical protein
MEWHVWEVEHDQEFAFLGASEGEAMIQVIVAGGVVKEVVKVQPELGFGFRRGGSGIGFEPLVVRPELGA